MCVCECYFHIHTKKVDITEIGFVRVTEIFSKTVFCPSTKLFFLNSSKL